MIYNGTDKKIAFTNERPMTGTLIDYYEISDNEMIKSIKIYDQTGKEVSWRTQLKSGDYTIIVQDIYGNSLKDTLTIIIID